MASISLQIAVQPPLVARLGTIINPPLTATMRSTTVINGYSSDLSRVWAFATLIDDYGEVVIDQLSGTLAESAHASDNGDEPIVYFLFDKLSIESVGSFRIRVTLMRMDNNASEAASVLQVESNKIVVEDQEVERQLPSSSEQRFLDSLAT